LCDPAHHDQHDEPRCDVDDRRVGVDHYLDHDVDSHTDDERPDLRERRDRRGKRLWGRVQRGLYPGSERKQRISPLR
jgi:hypothetical protein